MRSLFKILYHQHNPDLMDTNSYQFYLRHQNLLRKKPYQFLLNSNEPINIVIGKIVIESLILKEKLDAIIKKYIIKEDNFIAAKAEMKALLNQSPSFVYEDARIYLPIFSPHINQLYTTEFEKFTDIVYQTILKDYTALLIEPLNTYKHLLFNYLPQQAVMISLINEEFAFYDKDLLILFFISSLGHLDNQIAFDQKQINNFSELELIKNLRLIADPYLNYDKEKFINVIKNSSLLPLKTQNKINEVLNADL